MECRNRVKQVKCRSISAYIGSFHSDKKSFSNKNKNEIKGKEKKKKSEKDVMDRQDIHTHSTMMTMMTICFLRAFHLQFVHLNVHVCGGCCFNIDLFCLFTILFKLFSSS